MIAAYEGDLPYIFVSYAHKDSREVFDLIEKLAARGYRIWYDEGIEPGSEWPENIAAHLLKADMFLAIITNDSMNSVNCRREINYALSKNKPFLSVVLEQTAIPAGMELQMSSQQSVLRYNYSDEKRFLDKIESCSAMGSCKGEQIPSDTGAANVSAAVPSMPKSKFPKPLIIAVVAAFLVGAFYYIGTSQNTTTTNPPAESKVSDISDDGSNEGGSTVDTTTDGSTPSTEITVTPEISNPRWKYAVSEDDTSLIYTFSSGPVVVMPVSWRDKVMVMDQGDYFSFYHYISNYEWRIDGMDRGGELFSLCYRETQDYKDNPSYRELGGSSADGYYFLMFPTDYPGYAEDERACEEYDEMYQELNYVKKNSHFVFK